MKINRDQIITKLKTFPVLIKEYLKTVYNLPHSGKYFLLSLILIIFFLIITFPYDSLIKKRIYELEGKMFRSIDISDFDFSVFGETYLENVNILMMNSNELSCKNTILNIALNPYTLFLNNNLIADFQFDHLKFTGKEIEMIFNINGNLDLLFDKQSGIPKNGFVKIILSDTVLKLNNLTIPGPMGPLTLKIESVNIQSGNMDSSIANGVLRFAAFKLTGNDISCDIAGTVELANPAGNSRLDLTINIDSESLILDQYRDLLSSFIKDNVISLRIKGIASRPELSLNRVEKNEN